MRLVESADILFGRLLHFPLAKNISIEDVRRHLAAYLPELAQATHTENTLPDGTVEITFHKQVTTKG